MERGSEMRCEGWTKPGVFMLGPSTWKQCPNEAVVLLTVEQEEIFDQPSCLACWTKAIDRGIKILKSEPLSVL